jgi:hypothetical protein
MSRHAQQHPVDELIDRAQAALEELRSALRESMAVSDEHHAVADELKAEVRHQAAADDDLATPQRGGA